MVSSVRPRKRRPTRFGAGAQAKAMQVARKLEEVALSNAWRAWLTENLLLDVPRKELVETMATAGVPRALARQEIEDIERSTLYAGARRIAVRVRRHEMVARLLRTQDQAGGEASTIERRAGLSHDEFIARYYAANRPVVLTDALAAWPALARWSPSTFRERFGDAEVEIMSRRDDGPIGAIFIEGRPTTVRLADFCDRVVSAGATDDFYLAANNGASRNAALRPLFDDLRAPHPCLDDQRDGQCISLWMGPAGTVTPLHYDAANSIFCQVFGRKRLYFYPPFELALLHETYHCYRSAFDPEHPDFDAFPELAGAVRREVVLQPGEAVFIPVGWWHHVRALEASINLSFTNFRVPNRVPWYTPGWLR